MKELSERDIQEIVGGIPSSNLVLFCPGLQGRGSTLIDRSQSANHGTISGATWVRLPSGLWVLSFDGTNDYVDCGHNVIFDDLSESTFLAWVNLTAVASSVNIICSRDGNSKLRFGVLGTNWGNALNINISGTDYIAGTAWTNLWSTWVLVGATISESTNTLKLYINGVEDYSKTDWTGTIPSMVGVSMLLGHAGGYKGKGKEGLFTFYNRVLSATEILRIYTRQRRLLGV
jgi:hypothetical protein